MKSESSNPSGLVDLAEKLRQEGRIEDALLTVKRSLELDPQLPRAVLLHGRLLYQTGNVSQALDQLRSLDALLVADDGFKSLTHRLEQQILEMKDIQTESRRSESFFATESMARVLAQQGYHLEALRVYRQLYLASGSELRLWKAILELRYRLQQEGSRGSGKEAVIEELAQLNNWIEAQQKG